MVAASTSGNAVTGVDPTPGPKHVAIIMDGNGRWANARGLPRAVGHERGVEALRRTVEAAPEFGIRYLTLYSFSTENWRRPAAEVSALFNLLRAYVKKDLARLKKEGVRIRIIGSRDKLPKDIAELTRLAEEETAQNSDFYLTIAFNYGGRDELTRAVAKIADDLSAGVLSATDVSEDLIGRYLDTNGLPDPDLLIRTSGESRLSNFLPWQLTYAELIFMDVLWPDFGREVLGQAIEEFCHRERRYGAVQTGAPNG